MAIQASASAVCGELLSAACKGLPFLLHRAPTAEEVARTALLIAAYPPKTAHLACLTKSPMVY